MRLRNRKWATLPDETAMNRALAKACDTTVSQTQRITGDNPPAVGIDFVERVAFAFDVRPQDMLTPYFGATTYELGPPEPDRHARLPGTAIHESSAR